MKRMKKFLALVLTLVFVSGLTIPSFAADQQDEQIKIVSSGSNDPAAHILPDSDVFGIDVKSLGIISNGTGEEITAAPPAAIDSSRTDMTRALANVTTYAELSAALANSNVSIIVLLNNIIMTDCLTITHNVNFLSGANAPITLTSASGKRHFKIEDENYIDILFDNVILDGNNTGGGIEITHTHVTVYGANIQNCNSGIGSAIFALNQYLVYYAIDDFYVLNTGSLYISNSTFENNTAVSLGGAIASYGPLSINNSTLSDNYSAESGGAIYMGNLFSDNIPVLSISNVTIEDNEALHYGGGIFILASTVNISDSEITDNSASAGGGVYSLISTTTITDSEIYHNSIASTNTNPVYEDIGGAAIHASGRLVLDGTDVSDNDASMPVGYGAGVLMVDDALLGNNNLTYHYNGTEEIVVTDSDFSGNSNFYQVNGIEVSNFNGGGIAAIGVSLTVGSTDNSLLDFSYNYATNGGGIYSTDTANISNAHIHDNIALECGGGIYSTDTLVLSGTVNIENNFVMLHGGGIYGKYITFSANSTIEIFSNIAESGDMISNGGGVYVYYGHFYFYAGYICYNDTEVTGGGLYLDHSLVTTIDPIIIITNIYGNTPNNYTVVQ